MGVSLAEVVEARCAVHTDFKCSSMLLVQKWKLGKPSKLMCFDSEMLFLTCLGPGCQGKLIPDLCGKQPKVVLPEPWSSWASMQTLRDVEDEASSWAGLVSSQPGPFLPHHRGFFCGSANIAWKWLCYLLRRKEVIHFQQICALVRLSLLSRGSKLSIFLSLAFLELYHHLYTLINHTNYSKYVPTYTKVAKKEKLWDYLAWLQHPWKRHLLCVTQFVRN